MIGEVIDKFRVERLLGQNQLGEVWQADHVETGAKVAIRFVRPELSALAESEAVLGDLVKISRVAHANIAKVYFGGRHGNRVFAITELVAGEPLPQRIARLRMSSTQVADVIRQVADALITALAAGVTHHDLTSTNVFLVPDAERGGGERAVVVDFGLARLVDVAPQFGNPTYMAPEAHDGMTDDARIDVYSLGCIGFEAAAGRPPFTSKNPEELRQAHRSTLPPLAKSLVADVIPALENLVQRMLAKAPEARASLKDISKMATMIVGVHAPDEATAMH